MISDCIYSLPAGITLDEWDAMCLEADPTLSPKQVADQNGIELINYQEVMVD